MKLRNYQHRGADLLRKVLVQGHKRIIFWLATGGGKSAVFSFLVSKILIKKETVLIVVRRRELIFQAQKNLAKFGIEASVVMGSEKGFDPGVDVQICSIDTIHRRIDSPDFKFLKTYNWLIIDECHDTTSDKYREFMDKINFKACIGFTATPFRVGARVHDWWEICVKPIEMHELRDQGFLTAAEVYAPKKIDTSGIKKLGTDFHQKELFDRVSEMKVVGDIVETYLKYGQNKPAILFAVNKAHSILMCEAFKQAGVAAMHRDESHNKSERQYAIDCLTNGKVKILCNVNIFSTGVDVPCVEIMIGARPTLSENLYVQQVGRVLRPFAICSCGAHVGAEAVCHTEVYRKQKALIFDHADNTSRHGLPYKVRNAEMEKKDKEHKQKAELVPFKTCKECFAVFEPTLKDCPYCQTPAPAQEREVKTEDGELKIVQEEEIIMQDMGKDWVRWRNRERKFRVGSDKKYLMLHKKYGNIAFKFIEYPDWIRKEIIKDEFLRRTSNIIEENYNGSAKVIS